MTPKPKITTWTWIAFNGAKGHAIPQSLVSAVTKNMQERGCGITLRKPLQENGKPLEVHIDLPGSCYVDRPLEKFHFAGVTVVIPAEEVETFCGVLKAAEPRTHDQKTYYKLHGYGRCLVLTPSQRRYLLQLLRERVGKALVRVREFYHSKGIEGVVP